MHRRPFSAEAYFQGDRMRTRRYRRRPAPDDLSSSSQACSLQDLGDLNQAIAGFAHRVQAIREHDAAFGETELFFGGVQALEIMHPARDVASRHQRAERLGGLEPSPPDGVNGL